jgi:hypothetical protein
MTQRTTKDFFVNVPGQQLTQGAAVKAFLARGYAGEEEPAGICWEGPAGSMVYRRFSELTPAQQRLIGEKR